MTTEELILQKLDALEACLHDELAGMKKSFSEIDKRFQDIDCFLDRHSHRQEILAKRADAQEEKIDRLTQIVNRLAADRKNVIWEARDRRAVGLDPSTVYGAFDDIGISRIEGLRLLEAAKKLLIDCDSRGTIHRAKKVRISPSKTVRAIVILTE